MTHKPNMKHVALIAAVEQAEGTLDRHRRHLERLVRYHDECPDGDPRKERVERDMDRVMALKNHAEREAMSAADKLIEFEDGAQLLGTDEGFGYWPGEDTRPSQRRGRPRSA